MQSGRQWRVPLPGQEDIPFKEVRRRKRKERWKEGLFQITYLTKVDTTCQVLSTKTRPKKMIMRGSDGIEYDYYIYYSLGDLFHILILD